MCRFNVPISEKAADLSVLYADFGKKLLETGVYNCVMLVLLARFLCRIAAKLAHVLCFEAYWCDFRAKTVAYWCNFCDLFISQNPANYKNAKQDTAKTYTNPRRNFRFHRCLVKRLRSDPKLGNPSGQNR